MPETIEQEILLATLGTGARLSGVKVATSTLKIGELEQLLDNCLDKQTYYYDVVSKLDRAVYQPVIVSVET